MIMTTDTYTFNDVLIKPKYSEVKSRKDVDISVEFGKIVSEIPVISANMKTITGSRMALEMGKRGAWSCLHRFNTIEEAREEYEEAKEQIPLVSIGVNGESKERFQELSNAGAKFFCVDVAHGHHILVKEMIKYIKSENANAYVMAGNVATPEGYKALAKWGADAVKVGIGPGSMCQTRTNTGVGVPQLWAFEQIAKQRQSLGTKSAMIVGDGGIKSVGDMAKSYKFVDAIMLGSFFAGCMETPGDVYKRKDGSRYKVYGGSASGHNKGANGKRPEFVEGVTEEVPLGDHVKFLLREIKEGVQSACSYVGAFNIKEFKTKCEFIRIGSGGKEESKL